MATNYLMEPRSWQVYFREDQGTGTADLTVTTAGTCSEAATIAWPMTMGTGDTWYGDSDRGWHVVDNHANHIYKIRPDKDRRLAHQKAQAVQQTQPVPNPQQLGVSWPVPGPAVLGPGVGGSIGVSTNNVTFQPQPNIQFGTQGISIDPAPDRNNMRRSPPMEFNKFLNCSDLLELFLLFLKEQGVRQHQVMGLRFEYFVKWLIISAAEFDDEEPEVVMPALPSPRPHCLGCGKFMAAAMVIPMALHGAQCASWYFKRKEALENASR